MESANSSPERVLVLGLGNLLHADDGLGVHAIERLQKDSRVPPGAELLDGGTHGLALLSHVSGVDRLLVIDSVDVGQEPGAVIRLEGEALQRFPGKPSVHQLGFADLMIALELIGGRPQEVVLLGIQPLSTEWSPELTAPVRKGLDRLIEAAVEQLASWTGQPAIA